MKKFRKIYAILKDIFLIIAHPDKNYQNAGYRKHRT
jgi:hypothetical protein